MKTSAILLSIVLLLLLAASCKEKTTSTVNRDNAPAVKVQGMVWVPGGTFVMGTDEADAYEHERPAHEVKVSGFWMDESEVTNEQFQRFVNATGYISVAERKPSWEELKKQSPPG